jgi:pimeloyl-ACP methyl ester carboxylesterase
MRSEASLPDSAVRVRPSAPRSRLRGWLRRSAFLLLLLYLLLCLLLYFFQGRLIFPGQATQGQASSVVRPPAGTERLTLRAANGDRIIALFGPALAPDGSPLRDAAKRPTLLYFYGNGNCVNDCLLEFYAFRRLGVNVLIPDYAGYGMSEGSAGEAGCYATADAAYACLLTRKDVDPQRLFAAGWSLGSAVAIDLAARKSVIGLITFSAFSSMADMAHRQYPLVPVSLLLRHRFENEKKMARIACPVFLAHGTRDTFVPFAMRDRLASAARGPVTRVDVPGAHHGDIFAVGGPRLFQRVGAFLDACSRDGK